MPVDGESNPEPVLPMEDTTQDFFVVRNLQTSMAAENPFGSYLIAPCAMNCAIFLAFLREKNRCNGCYSPDRKCRKNCTIFACKLVRNRFCHTCKEFPCKRLRQLDLRYRKKYGMSMIGNLETIGQQGIRKFVKTKKRAEDLSGMRRVNLCSPGFLFHVR